MLKPSLQLRVSQQLTMTPQLQQAIRLLQLPVMELQTQIREALDENLMLEIDEEAAAQTETPETQQETDDDTEDFDDVTVATESQWDDSQHTGESEAARSNSDLSRTIEYADHSEESLRDHLLWQIELERFDPRSAAIGEAIIDAINDDGYLIDNLEVIRTTLTPDVIASLAEIESVLARVQNFDPVGIGARSVSECIVLQLTQLDPATSGLELAKTLATEHLGLVAEHQYPTLRRILDATEPELDDALALVRACHPRPGATIYAPAAEHIVPDVFVRRRDGQWVVELNGSVAPALRVNPVYASSIGRNDEYDVLRTQLQEARWLIRSLEIRNETLLKVAVTIVQRQGEFLEKGEEFMRPLVLKDVAEAIEMHESTVSRVTTGKYMHTPRGVFEFRYFFSSHVTCDDGNQSSTAVRAKIRKLIAGEEAGKPLSDSRIATMLSDSGVSVARRTVAKYREAMNIPSSSDRKRDQLVG